MSSVGIFKLDDGMSLMKRYRQRGRRIHQCGKCTYKTPFKGNLQKHSRIHLNKKNRPDFYSCVTTCKKKNGDVYSHRHLYRVKKHMKACRWFRLTQPSIPKGMIEKEKVCLLASKLDVWNNKMNKIIKELGNWLGRDLLDYNISGALRENINIGNIVDSEHRVTWTLHTGTNHF